MAATVEEETPKPVSVGVPTLQQDDSGFAVDPTSELKWDVTMNIVGRAVVAPSLSVCQQCDLPVLIYGRMVSGGGEWRGRMEGGGWRGVGGGGWRGMSGGG